MEEKTLVTYASKYGATAEIAERIGEVLRREGSKVETLPVDRVDGLAGYSTVVLGIAVYMGRWRKEAVRFLKANEQELSNRPVWLFSSGPSGNGDPVTLLKGWRFPPAQQAMLDRISPRDIAVFHGAVMTDRVSGFDKWIIRKVKAPEGDFRDWNAIESWARTVAADRRQKK